MRVPGLFWVGLISTVSLALVPVLEQNFPESTYWWSPLLISGVLLLAKGAQLYREHTKEPPLQMPAIEPVVIPDAARAAVYADLRTEGHDTPRPFWPEVLQELLFK